MIVVQTQPVQLLSIKPNQTGFPCHKLYDKVEFCQPTYILCILMNLLLTWKSPVQILVFLA